MLYIAIDGDNIGATVERLIILEQRNELTEYAISIEKAIVSIAERLRFAGANIVFTGGDSVLAYIDKEQTEILDCLSFESEFAFSVGLGSTMREAYLSLKMAKASGKGCAIRYHQLEVPIQLKKCAE